MIRTIYCEAFAGQFNSVLSEARLSSDAVTSVLRRFAVVFIVSYKIELYNISEIIYFC
jgi:hypothetical protein